MPSEKMAPTEKDMPDAFHHDEAVKDADDNMPATSDFVKKLYKCA